MVSSVVANDTISVNDGLNVTPFARSEIFFRLLSNLMRWYGRFKIFSGLKAPDSERSLVAGSCSFLSSVSVWLRRTSKAESDDDLANPTNHAIAKV